MLDTDDANDMDDTGDAGDNPDGLAADVERAVAALERLVAFDTVSSRSNAPLIESMRADLEAVGFTTTVLPDAATGKAGLLATVGPLAPGGTVLSGHSDVVPVDGQIWTGDPFLLRRDGRRLHGRGTADMKGFLACALALAPAMAAAPLRRPIHLCVSYDEEITCEGVRPLIAHLLAELSPVGAVIVGEPTGGRVVTQHKGAYGWVVTVRGVPCHSSMPHLGVSATALAARLITWLDDRHRDRLAGALPGVFEPNATTGHTGRVSGGEAVNIIAAECTFDIELRNIPGDDPYALLAEFRQEADRLLAAAAVPGASIEIVTDYAVPAFGAQGAATELCLRLTGQADTIAATYSTEAGHFQDAGMSTVLCGPGAIDQAHTADEYIEVGELAACCAFLGRLIAEHC